MRLSIILALVAGAMAVATHDAAAWTWPVGGPVLQPFALADPYASGQHRGIDIAADAAEDVLAPTSGVVSFAGAVPSNGKTVTIETPDGLSVTLVHLAGISVAAGERVPEGATIGSAGETAGGEWPRPYVHLGVRRTADRHGYVDPLTVLPPRLAPAPVEPAPPAMPGPGEVANPPPPAAPGSVDVPEQAPPPQVEETPAPTLEATPAPTPEADVPQAAPIPVPAPAEPTMPPLSEAPEVAVAPMPGVAPAPEPEPEPEPVVSGVADGASALPTASVAVAKSPPTDPSASQPGAAWGGSASGGPAPPTATPTDAAMATDPPVPAATPTASLPPAAVPPAPVVAEAPVAPLPMTVQPPAGDAATAAAEVPRPAQPPSGSTFPGTLAQAAVPASLAGVSGVGVAPGRQTRLNAVAGSRGALLALEPAVRPTGTPEPARRDAHTASIASTGALTGIARAVTPGPPLGAATTVRRVRAAARLSGGPRAFGPAAVGTAAARSATVPAVGAAGGAVNRGLFALALLVLAFVVTGHRRCCRPAGGLPGEPAERRPASSPAGSFQLATERARRAAAPCPARPVRRTAGRRACASRHSTDPLAALLTPPRRRPAPGVPFRGAAGRALATEHRERVRAKQVA